MIAQRLSGRIQQISQLQIREEAATAGKEPHCRCGKDTAGGVCKPWRGGEGRDKHSGGGGGKVAGRWIREGGGQGRRALHSGKGGKHSGEGGWGCRGLLSGRGDITILIKFDVEGCILFHTEVLKSRLILITITFLQSGPSLILMKHQMH
jgi:hypothetical protein